MARKKKQSKGGLRGAPRDHEASFNKLIKEAKRPDFHGCNNALILLGGAYAEMNYFKPTLKQRRELIKADEMLYKRCKLR
jgi:hypothetical protein